jgi:hypothetical protein
MGVQSGRPRHQRESGDAVLAEQAERAGDRQRRQLAEALVITEATVKSHVGHILVKIGARDRVQAVIFAYESGLVAAARR